MVVGSSTAGQSTKADGQMGKGSQEDNYRKISQDKTQSLVTVNLVNVNENRSLVR